MIVSCIVAEVAKAGVTDAEIQARQNRALSTLKDARASVRGQTETEKLLHSGHGLLEECDLPEVAPFEASLELESAEDDNHEA